MCIIMMSKVQNKQHNYNPKYQRKVSKDKVKGLSKYKMPSLDLSKINT